MFCPVCKSEYRQGVTLCPDCSVALVPNLPAVPGPGGSLVRLWAGENLALHETLLEELDAADIQFFDRPIGSYPGARRTDLLLLERGPRFGFEVFVLSSQSASAKKILDRLLEEEPEDMDLPASDAAAEEKDADRPVHLEQEPAYEVWRGDDASTIEFLEVALRENEIPLRREADGDTTKILVSLRDEPRAREILREISEASPPE